MTTSPSSRLLNTSELKRLAAADVFKGIFVVKSLIKKTDKNGRPYWEITVSDTAGDLGAKIWSDAGWWDRSNLELENKPDMLTDAQVMDLKGKTVGITGKVADFRGQLQYNFNGISLLNQSKFPPASFVAHSDVPLPVLLQRLESIIEGCGLEIRNFLKFVFSGERVRAFGDAPAAVSNHHAYAHGLLEHTLTVTECAKIIAAAYRDSYPSIDVDIVVAGALLHDLGKIESYSMSPTPEITLAGAVLDHIALGYSTYVRLAGEAGLSDSLRMQIGHILLSHHGQKEFGSPVLPATPEALIVSSADELDFRLFCWKDAVKDLAPNQDISLYHFAAQRRFWRTGGGEEKGEG
ncbi:MAG: HD domain-containing protein [Synergistaceae bacterium]|jgi:3'-5' exoribonuclease|nr:HD domain-containing protein [Synergistaceae bacterium]